LIVVVLFYGTAQNKSVWRNWKIAVSFLHYFYPYFESHHIHYEEQGYHVGTEKTNNQVICIRQILENSEIMSLKVCPVIKKLICSYIL
jgi:hypothetical protein